MQKSNELVAVNQDFFIIFLQTFLNYLIGYQQIEQHMSSHEETLQKRNLVHFYSQTIISQRILQEARSTLDSNTNLAHEVDKTWRKYLDGRAQFEFKPKMPQSDMRAQRRNLATNMNLMHTNQIRCSSLLTAIVHATQPVSPCGPLWNSTAEWLQHTREQHQGRSRL